MRWPETSREALGKLSIDELHELESRARCEIDEQKKINYEPHDKFLETEDEEGGAQDYPELGDSSSDEDVPDVRLAVAVQKAGRKRRLSARRASKSMLSTPDTPWEFSRRRVSEETTEDPEIARWNARIDELLPEDDNGVVSSCRQIGCIYKGGVIGAVEAEVKSAWRKMKVTVDSGAAESVIPPDVIDNYPLIQHKDDIYYGTASGEPLKNLGELKLPMVTPSRRLKGMTFQACDVTKPLASVANMLNAGQAVIFAPEAYGGSCVVDLSSGDEEPLTLQDGNFIMEVWVPPPEALPGFVRQP